MNHPGIAEAGSPLDESVNLALTSLEEEAVPAPCALYLLGTGLGALHSTLSGAGPISLGRLSGAPVTWRHAELYWARIDGQHVWFIEDAPANLEVDEPLEGNAWDRAWPIWLAAAAGASLCVISAAGIGLRGGDVSPDNEIPVGSLAMIQDHINMSGSTPLVGLGETRLGPLFPDQSDLHHEGLRLQFMERAAQIGVQVKEGVVACTFGPTLNSPAEIAWLSRSGANVVAQDLADPLIACAHAGLATVAIVAITDDGTRPMGMEELVRRCEACAPALQDLMASLAPDCVKVAADLAEDFV
ncbi:MAG: purine-nucleoside phosphorylase [Planctomycetota bacterium]|jgi:purine-nucleoside phosphorylase